MRKHCSAVVSHAHVFGFSCSNPLLTISSWILDSCVYRQTESASKKRSYFVRVEESFVIVEWQAVLLVDVHIQKGSRPETGETEE